MVNFILIPNIKPDFGLIAPFNSRMTLCGRFFRSWPRSCDQGPPKERRLT